MTSDLDPSVLQLFDEQRQPLDGGHFILQVAVGLEREERRQRWRRRLGLATALLLIALLMPWMLRTLAPIAAELTAAAPSAVGDAGFDQQWLPLALLCFMAFGLGSLWRLLRSAR